MDISDVILLRLGFDGLGGGVCLRQAEQIARRLSVSHYVSSHLIKAHLIHGIFYGIFHWFGRKPSIHAVADIIARYVERMLSMSRQDK